MDIRTVKLEDLKGQFTEQSAKVSKRQDLEMLKRDWLGKNGIIKTLFKQISSIESEKRPQYATDLNELKSTVEVFLKEQRDKFEIRDNEQRLESEFIDLSLPSRFMGRGNLHPVTRVDRKVTKLLRMFGMSVADGPEIENEYFCFDSLNIPPHHPARDMQDTFYTSTGHLLRTHTTSVQARALKKGGLPVKIVSPGRVYRNETVDASHTAMFHQYELIWIDKGLTLANLMAVLAMIAKELYGKKAKIRFVPKYYPYTEPSLGLAVACSICKGKGCSACGDSGWATVVGAGMVHRKVLGEFGYDYREVSGMAFGFGSSRLAAQQFGFPRLKMVYENDLRVLEAI